MPRRIIFLLILAAVCLSPVLSQQLDSLLAMRDSTVINEEQLDLQLQIAYVLSDTDIRRAVDLAYNALRDAEALGSARWTAEAKLAIGRFYDFLGVNEEAAGLLMEAFASFVTLGDSLKQATTLMHIGNNYFYVDQFEPALQYFHMVSDFGRELKDTSLIISGLNSTAAVYGNTNRMDSALVLFREAHALAREFGSLEQEILALYNIGDVHLYSGRRTQALEFFHDLENYYNLRVNSPKYLSSLYNSMTKAYLEKQNLQLAREYSEKTLQALRENMRLTEYQEYYLNLYKIDSAENRTGSALSHYIRYTELHDSLNNASFKESLTNMGIGLQMQLKESQIERLTLDNQFKDLEIRQKRLTNYGYVALSVLMVTIVFLVIRSYRKMKEKNALLQKQAEDLKAAQQRLVQSEKMASIGTLTAGIAHEINNPLNFISGGLNIVKELHEQVDWKDRKEEEQRHQMATTMALDGLERAVGIVKALMTFSHRGGSKKVATDLNDTIDKTLMFLSSRISDDIQVKKEYGLTSNVYVFPEKMHQVIMNILDNAIYAVKKVPYRPPVIAISTSSSNGQAVLSFTNSGPAIADNHLDQLFDPFFTTKDPGQGTGLGLSICYTLITEHDGEISAQNTPEGVNFTVRIPLM